jgi:type IV secretory pathway TraG/TraD family ATPase VirD4
VTEARERGQRCVVFDLTGAFVEAFYEEGRDHILNPMDQRCPPWTIFNDCQNYDYISAAAALIPSDGGNAEPFWAMAARTLFVEMCVKLAASGETTNGAIAHHLMSADLKAVHAKLANTIASPLTAVEAARMAESIRAVFNTNAQDPLPARPRGGRPGTVLDPALVQEEPVPGSILFITSTHTDLTLNRALLTLWMDLAVNALMGMPRTRDLRMWYLFDEVHALHRMPAIEHGLQTARGFGGAFVLGMHSFDKLAETYGEEGAINLASLARTKLILATADKNTAEVCSNFIGFREVRETDEAYSIGASRSRDAATITPRTEVKPLVIPDDIMNLPSLHGYVKFPEGFPAARIRLLWRDYPKIAEPFLRKTDMQLAAYVPQAGGDAEDAERR